MTILQRYDEVNNVSQRDLQHGCIPWAIEWMIRYKTLVSGISYMPEDELNVFQDKYNLQELTVGEIRNNFSNIIDTIRDIHPDIPLSHNNGYPSGTGRQKFQDIERLIRDGVPSIMPIKPSPQSSAHIVPVIEVNQNTVEVIWRITDQGHQEISPFSKNDLIRWHDSGQSGRAIVCLQ